MLDAPDVYRSHYMRGMWKFEQRQMIEGERELLIAMSLYKEDPHLYFDLGQQYLNANRYRAAATLFRRSLERDSTFTMGRGRLAVALAELNQWPEAHRQALIALSQTIRPAPTVLAVLRLTSQEMRRERERRAGARPTIPTPRD